MKKFLALFLALLMIVPAAVAVNADVIYEDDFEDEEFNLFDAATGEGFWFKNQQSGEHGMGNFEESGGTLNGYDDARFGFSMYWGDEENNLDFADAYPMFKEMTGWIDIKCEDVGVVEVYYVGLIFADTYDKNRGYQEDGDYYSISYFPYDGEHMVTVPAEGGGTEEKAHTSFVRLSCSTPRKEKDFPDHIYGEYDIEGDPGFNINGDPVKIGVRYGRGNITAYANGKIVGVRDRETIGRVATPAVWIHNEGNYVELDNYGLGTYDHNVKKMTRLDSYTLYEGKVTVMDGENVAGEIAAAEDDELKIEAPKVAGRKFVKWDAVEIDGAAVTDFEKTALLYGITLGSLDDEKYEMTMPDCDVVLRAVYEDGESGSDVTPGDVDGNGKLNAKDVTAIMKYLVGKTPEKFVVEAADFDGNGKLNAKDVTALMKALVAAA